MLRRILYTSMATEGVTMKDAYDIIRVSHNRNSRAGITGGLVLIDGYFLQLMEGLPSAVELRFSHIQKDPRHCDIRVLADCPVQTALFADAWMALRDGSKIDPCVLSANGYTPGFDGVRTEQVLGLLTATFEPELMAA